HRKRVVDGRQEGEQSLRPHWVVEQAQRYIGRVRAGTRPALDPASRAAQGAAALRSGRAEEARDLLQQALSLAPEEGAVWFDLARALLELSRGNEQERYQLQSDAVGAAYAAVLYAANRAERAA